MAKPPHVLILGGGFVAQEAAAALRRPIRRGEVTATVVDRDNFFTFHGLIAEMVTGRIAPGNILNPPAASSPRRRCTSARSSRSTSRKAGCDEPPRRRAVRARVRPRRRVSRQRGEPRVLPGLAEHAFRLKNFDDCLRLKNRVVEMFELADVEPDKEERRRLLTFFIAGGSPGPSWPASLRTSSSG